jgi:hypothetical protein
MLISYVDPQTLPGNVLRLRGSLEAALSRSSPGVGAMTDFSTETPARVVPGRHIDDALQDMIRAGIRSLLVVDEGAAVLGLITAADILGTRPLQFLQNPLCESHPHGYHTRARYRTFGGWDRASARINLQEPAATPARPTKR